METLAAILKTYCTFSPELKGQLTGSLVGSIGVTCKLQIAKLVLIGNLIWLPS